MPFYPIRVLNAAVSAWNDSLPQPQRLRGFGKASDSLKSVSGAHAAPMWLWAESRLSLMYLQVGAGWWRQTCREKDSLHQVKVCLLQWSSSAFSQGALSHESVSRIKTTVKWSFHAGTTRADLQSGMKVSCSPSPVSHFSFSTELSRVHQTRSSSSRVSD